MCGEEDAAWRLHAAAGEAELILVEGVMGLYDGTPSGADIARRFGIPVMAVIDAGAMAQTFGALARGLASYQPDLPFSGCSPITSAARATPRCCARRCPPAWSGMVPWRATPKRRCPSATSACCRRPRSAIRGAARPAGRQTRRDRRGRPAAGGGFPRAAARDRSPAGWPAHRHRARRGLRLHLPGQPRDAARAGRRGAILLAGRR